MGRRDDLEAQLRDCAAIIREYEELLRLSDDPKEQRRARRSIQSQQAFLDDQAREYVALCRRSGSLPALDLRDLLADIEGLAVIEGSAESAKQAPPAQVRVSAAELRLWLHRREDSYTIFVSARSPHSQTEVQPVDGELPRLIIDRATLLATGADLVGYGAALSAMLFADERLERAFADCYQRAVGAGVPLRLRLGLDDDPLAQSIIWELLCFPRSSRFIATDQQTLLSRQLSSADPAVVRARVGGRPTALVAVAAPGDLGRYGLESIDRLQEQQLVAQALDGYTIAMLPAASLGALADGLRAEPDILYIVSHGATPPAGPCLYLENHQGETAPTSVAAMVSMLQGLARRPRLVVTASCASAGRGVDEQELAQALGPALARAGVGAVLAMQGPVSLAAVRRGVPILFGDLLAHGVIDLAVTNMRQVLANAGHDDWWRPSLLMRLDDGIVFGS